MMCKQPHGVDASDEAAWDVALMAKVAGCYGLRCLYAREYLCALSTRTLGISIA